MGGVHAGWQRVDGVQHAVDAQAHVRGGALGLDVNVRAAVVEGVAQQVVHRLHHGLVRGLQLLRAAERHQLLEVADLRLGGEVVRRAGQRLLEAVDLRDGLEDVRLGRQHRLDGHAGETVEVLEQLPVERVGHRHHEPALRGALQRQQRVLLREGTGHGARGQRHVQLERVDLPVRHAGGARGGLRDTVLVQHAPALGQLHLEGGDDLHRRHVISCRLLGAALPLRLEHPGAGGRLARQDILGLLRGEQALGNKRLEHERRAEVRLAAVHRIQRRDQECRPPMRSSSATTPKSSSAEPGPPEQPQPCGSSSPGSPPSVGGGGGGGWPPPSLQSVQPASGVANRSLQVPPAQ